MQLNSSLRIDLTFIDEQFTDCPDLIKRRVTLNGSHEGYFIYFEGLVDSNLLQSFFSQILSMEWRDLTKEEMVLNLPLEKISLCCDQSSLKAAILSGKILFIADPLGYAIAFEPEKSRFEKLEQSGEEKSIYSLNESFGDQLRANLALLRRKIQSNRLKFVIFKYENNANEQVALAYLEGTTASVYLNTFYQKAGVDLKKGTVAIPVEQALKDDPYSPFPQYQYTKSLDLAVSAIPEGRLVIIKTDSPVVILTPVSLFTFFKAPGDIHSHPIVASGLQLIRIAAILAVVFLPGLYVAVTSFHYQFLQANFLITLAESRIGVPFLPIIEVLLMEIILTIFFELSTKFSAPTNIWILIGGGLFLTGALLSTGLVSGFLLFISGLSFAASYLISIYHLKTIRLLRLMIILFAAVFGMLGVAISSSLILSHLIVLKSLGQPYLKPFTFKGNPAEP